MKIFSRETWKNVEKIISYEKKKWYHYQIQKVNYIAGKMFVIHVKKSLVLKRMMKNTIKSDITVNTLRNIETLLIIFVI